MTKYDGTICYFSVHSKADRKLSLPHVAKNKQRTKMKNLLSRRRAESKKAVQRIPGACGWKELWKIGFEPRVKSDRVIDGACGDGKELMKCWLLLLLLVVVVVVVIVVIVAVMLSRTWDPRPWPNTCCSCSRPQTGPTSSLTNNNKDISQRSHMIT